MNGTFVQTIAQIAIGAININDGLYAYLLNGDWVVNFDTTSLMSGVPAGVFMAGSGALTGVTTSGGAIHADPVTFPAVGPDTDHVRAVLVAIGTGGAARALAYLDRRADTRLINILTIGDNIDVVWNPAGICNI